MGAASRAWSASEYRHSTHCITYILWDFGFSSFLWECLQSERARNAAMSQHRNGNESQYVTEVGLYKLMFERHQFSMFWIPNI